MKSALIVGLGSIGSGLKTAFLKNGYKTLTVDPYQKKADFVMPFEAIDDETLNCLLEDCTTVCYSAEIGNRDDYIRNPTLVTENAERYTHFVKKISEINPAIHVNYIGGSWTRYGTSDESLNVKDGSVLKPDPNVYEQAKTVACALCSDLSEKYNICCTFWDYISVVPNYSPNFTIYKMVSESERVGEITVSKGDYGRPLLHSDDAGEAVVKYVDKVCNDETSNLLKHFRVVIMPGSFTKFEIFFDVVGTVLNKLDPKINPNIVGQETTPVWLRTRCEGSQILKDIGFTPDTTLIERGLMDTCEAAVKEIYKVGGETKFKMCALDLDGTLLGSDHQLSAATIEKVRELSAKGVIIALATGRSGPAVYDHVEALGLGVDIPAVIYNGGVIMNFKAGTRAVDAKPMLVKSVPSAVAKSCIEVAGENGWLLQYYTHETIYANPKGDEHRDLMRRYVELTGASHTIVTDNYQGIAAEEEAIKILIMCDEAIVDEVMKVAKENIKGCTLIRGGFFIEVLRPGVCKGNTLVSLCEQFGIAKLEQTIAFGDGDNDVEFLELAGCGVAMKNAREGTKKVADMVTEFDNAEDGVAKFLAKLQQEGKFDI